MEETDFLELVDAVKGHCSLEVMRVLMKTFSDQPDYGTQERVLSIMAGGNPRDAMTAILEELPRLTSEAPEWAVTLVITEFEYHRALMTDVAQKMPKSVKAALDAVINQKVFRDEFPDASADIIDLQYRLQ